MTTQQRPLSGHNEAIGQQSHRPLGRSHQRKLPQLLQQINSLSFWEEKQPVIIYCLSFYNYAMEKAALWDLGKKENINGERIPRNLDKQP